MDAGGPGAGLELQRGNVGCLELFRIEEMDTPMDTSRSSKGLCPRSKRRPEVEQFLGRLLSLTQRPWCLV